DESRCGSYNPCMSGTRDMYRVQHVNSYAELLAAVADISNLSDTRFLFRGQTQDYAGKMLVSSARRRSTPGMLRRLQAWLPAIHVLSVSGTHRGASNIPRGASFVNEDASPAWKSCI